MSEIKSGLQDVVIAESTISAIDGNKGELIYAGINIHELAENSNFEEVIYLLLHRRLPTADQLEILTKTLKAERRIPDGIIQLIKELPKKPPPHEYPPNGDQRPRLLR